MSVITENMDKLSPSARREWIEMKYSISILSDI